MRTRNIECKIFPCGIYNTIRNIFNSKTKRKKVYDILFKAGAETLEELAGDKKYLGAEIGFMEVLHTWGQTLVYHPHIHVIIPAGGIDKIGKWKDSKKSNKIFRKIYT